MKLIGLILIIVVLLTGCTPSQDSVNICEEYANAENVTLLLPERVYVFNDIRMSEGELKKNCLTSS